MYTREKPHPLWSISGQPSTAYNIIPRIIINYNTWRVIPKHYTHAVGFYIFLSPFFIHTRTIRCLYFRYIKIIYLIILIYLNSIGLYTYILYSNAYSSTGWVGCKNAVNQKIGDTEEKIFVQTKCILHTSMTLDIGRYI